MNKRRLERLERTTFTADAPRTTMLTIRWFDLTGSFTEETREVPRIKAHDNVILTVEYDKGRTW